MYKVWGIVFPMSADYQRLYQEADLGCLGSTCILCTCTCGKLRTVTIVRPNTNLQNDIVFYGEIGVLLSPIVRKSTFCLCENKDPDILHGKLSAFKTFVFLPQVITFLHFLVSSPYIPYPPPPPPPFTAYFVLNLVRKPKKKSFPTTQL